MYDMSPAMRRGAQDTMHTADRGMLAEAPLRMAVRAALVLQPS